MMEWLRCRLGLGNACEPRYDPDTDETVRRLYAYAAKADNERDEIRSARLRGRTTQESRSYLGNRIANREDSQ